MASTTSAPVPEPLAVVIPFPTYRTSRSCSTCENARLPDDGATTYCAVYSEFIDDEWAAETCLSYEYCEEGTQDDDL